MPNQHLLLLNRILLLHAAARGIGRAGCAHLLKILLVAGEIHWTRAMELLFVLDDFWIDRFELGLETGVAGSDRRAVGATTRLSHVVVVVFELGDALTAPVAFTTALLLGGSWVLAGVSGLGEVAWEMLFWCGSAVGEANVVTVVVLVGASH